MEFLQKLQEIIPKWIFSVLHVEGHHTDDWNFMHWYCKIQFIFVSLIKHDHYNTCCLSIHTNVTIKCLFSRWLLHSTIYISPNLIHACDIQSTCRSFHNILSLKMIDSFNFVRKGNIITVTVKSKIDIMLGI